MTDLVATLSLSQGQLRDLSARICTSIRAGLTHDREQIRALPAYLRKPDPHFSGRAAALDVGGTNMRAAYVEVSNGTARLLANNGKTAWHSDLMQRATTPGKVTAEEFFQTQAALLAEACPEDSFHLGYCFSYPATITPERDAHLIRWNKGITIADVDVVGSALVKALARHNKTVSSFAVLNDTVASLLGGACIAPQHSHLIGLIVGTGTNMAGFFPVHAITKLTAAERAGWQNDELMAVNLESGNFDPADCLSPVDDRLAATLPPEQRKLQRFEKAVSGVYLPRLLALAAGEDACREAGFDPARDGAARVVELRNDPHLGAIAQALINRSADLVATALGGLIAAYAPQDGGKDVGILAEGSLFWKTPGYSDRVIATLARLLAPGESANIIPIPTDAASGQRLDPNWIGAASAALSR